jgi:hypothetical protein
MTTCEHVWQEADARVSRELSLWSPGAGWVPRGFCGASAGARGVELVLVAGEPSRPDTGERYDVEDSIEWAAKRSQDNMLTNRTVTHRGMQYILNFFFPGETIGTLFDRIFRMESVFCSIPQPLKEGSNVPTAVETTCGGNYVLPLLQAFPDALIVVAGRTRDKEKRKARERIKWLIEAHDRSLAERTIYVHHPAYWGRRKREAAETCCQELRGKHLRPDIPLLRRVRERARGQSS